MSKANVRISPSLFPLGYWLDLSGELIWEAAVALLPISHLHCLPSAWSESCNEDPSRIWRGACFPSPRAGRRKAGRGAYRQTEVWVFGIETDMFWSGRVREQNQFDLYSQEPKPKKPMKGSCVVRARKRVGGWEVNNPEIRCSAHDVMKSSKLNFVMKKQCKLIKNLNTHHLRINPWFCSLQTRS